jgi:membrane-associated protease RseP (regulator of RpoE activity)
MLTTYIVCFAIAMLIHELGHLVAAIVCRVRVSELGFGWGPKLIGTKLGPVEYKLHLLPLGAYTKIDIQALTKRPLSQQVFVLLAGIFVNIIAASIAEGTIFGSMNLLLAATNLLPLYQQDGWKCGMVMIRGVLNRKSPLVEWVFTITGAILSVYLFAHQVAANI